MKGVPIVFLVEFLELKNTTISECNIGEALWELLNRSQEIPSQIFYQGSENILA